MPHFTTHPITGKIEPCRVCIKASEPSFDPEAFDDFTDDDFEHLLNEEPTVVGKNDEK